MEGSPSSKKMKFENSAINKFETDIINNEVNNLYFIKDKFAITPKEVLFNKQNKSLNTNKVEINDLCMNDNTSKYIIEDNYDNQSNAQSSSIIKENDCLKRKKITENNHSVLRKKMCFEDKIIIENKNGRLSKDKCLKRNISLDESFDLLSDCLNKKLRKESKELSYNSIDKIDLNIINVTNNCQNSNLSNNTENIKNISVENVLNRLILSKGNRCQTFNNVFRNVSKFSPELNKNKCFKRKYFSESEDHTSIKKMCFNENKIIGNGDDVNEVVPNLYNNISELSTTINKDEYIKCNDTENNTEHKSLKRGYSLELEDCNLIKKMRIDIEIERTEEKKLFKYLTHHTKQKVVINTSTEDKRLIKLIDTLRKDGNLSFKKGDYDSAYNHYSDAINYGPKYKYLSSICYSNRALSLLKLNRISDALKDCEYAISLNCINYKAQMTKIKCLLDLKQYSEAENDIKAFNKIYDTKESRQLLDNVTSKVLFHSLIKKGQLNFENNSFNEALECYNEAINIDNTNVELFEKRASILFSLNRYNESLSDSNNVLLLNSNHSLSIDNKIKCLVKLERFHEAIKISKELQTKSPSKDVDNLLSWTLEMEKKANERNYYEILNVLPSASLSEIHKKYRKMTLLYHPDKLNNCELEAKLIQEEKFKKLNNMYTILSDPVTRKMYDIKLKCHRF